MENGVLMFQVGWEFQIQAPLGNVIQTSGMALDRSFNFCVFWEGTVFLRRDRRQSVGGVKH